VEITGGQILYGNKYHCFYMGSNKEQMVRVQTVPLARSEDTKFRATHTMNVL